MTRFVVWSLALGAIPAGITPASGQADAEQRVMDTGTERASEDALDGMEAMRFEPLDLNSAPARELERIPAFTSGLAAAVLRERDENGPFRSLRDFFRRMKTDSITARDIAPFAGVFPGARSAARGTAFRVSANRALPGDKGPAGEPFRGSAWRFRARWTLDSANGPAGGKLSAGVLAERDAYEPAWPDHAAATLRWASAGGRLSAWLGHFVVESGQGLVHGGPAGFFKGGDALAANRRSGSGARGCLSSDENAALFGAAAAAVFRAAGAEISVLAFGSRSGVDATVETPGRVTGFPSSGLHRSSSERRASGACVTEVRGGRVAAGFRRTALGASFRFTRYGIPVDMRDAEKRPFGFRGSGLAVWGLDAESRLGALALRAEWASGGGGPGAWIVNVNVESRGTAVLLSARRYPPSFYNPAANGFCESETSNETGLYTAFRRRASDRLRLEAYTDLFTHPGRTYFTAMPFRGCEYGIEAERESSPRLTLRFRARWRETEKAIAGAEGSGLSRRLLAACARRSGRVEAEILPNSALRLRLRAEFLSMGGDGTAGVKQGKETGFLLMQEARLRLGRRSWVEARWSAFGTDSWDARVTTFENDLPGTLGMVPLYGEGNRWSVLMRVGATENVALTIKAAASAAEGPVRKSPDAGRRTQGNVGVQLDWRGG